MGLDPASVLEIDSGHIELYKLLKLQGLVSSGGSAKLLIAEGEVKVNGKVERRKRKKILAGDIVEFRGDKVELRVRKR